MVSVLAESAARFFSRCPFDGTEHASFTRRNKKNGITLSAGTPGAPNSVNVGFGVVGNVVVDDVADAIHVQTTRRDVCGDQNIQTACLELVDHLFSLLLRHIAFIAAAAWPLGGQFFRQFRGGNFRANENQHAVEGFNFQNSG